MEIVESKKVAKDRRQWRTISVNTGSGGRHLLRADVDGSYKSEFILKGTHHCLPKGYISLTVHNKFCP